MSQTQLITLRPKFIADTDRVEWELEVPPGYDSYSVNSLNGFIFNQIFIEKDQALRINLNLRTTLEYIKHDPKPEWPDNPDFKGFIIEPEDLPPAINFYEDEYIYLVQDYSSKHREVNLVSAIIYDVKLDENGEKYWKKRDYEARYRGITDLPSPAIDETTKFADEDIPLKHGDFMYSTEDGIMIYNVNEEYPIQTGWWIAHNKTEIRPLRRFYKSIYDHTVEKYFRLSEITEIRSVTIYPDDYVPDNEYLPSELNDEILTFAYPPHHPSITQREINEAEGGYIFDPTVDYFVRESDSDILTFNSSIKVTQRSGRSSENVDNLKIGVQNTSGSSIFDSFIQHLNLHLACALYDYWVRSDSPFLENDWTNSSLYYRMIDTIKFASHEGSYRSNYVTTLYFREITPTIPYKRRIQELLTGYGTRTNDYYGIVGSELEEELPELFKPILPQTESIKIGLAGTRDVYPISLISGNIVTGNYFRKYLEMNNVSYENVFDDEIYIKFHKKIDEEFLPPTGRMFSTRSLSFQLFSRDITWDSGTEQIYAGIDGIMKYVIPPINPENPQPDPPIEPLHDTMIIPSFAPSYGFFNLWSPYLFISSSENTDTNIILNKDTKRESDTGITNICFKFVQTSPSYTWYSNQLPYSRIPINGTRKITFSLLDYAGRKIPLKCSSTHINIQALLELELYKTLEEQK